MWLLLHNLIKKQEVVRWQQGLERKTDGEGVEFVEEMRGMGFEFLFLENLEKKGIALIIILH